LNIVSQVGPDGNIQPMATQSMDDDWLLISPEHDSGTLKLMKLVNEALSYP